MRHALLVIAVVLALRVPYLNHPIQGDDVYYLLAAQHAQIEPAHPLHVRFAFEGQNVSMQGHTHGPFNAWYLGAVLALVGDIQEVPFHAAYIPFSLIAALSALALARRFTPQPLVATLLFLATPAFVINGNSLETDLPLLAWWLLATAAYVHGRFALAAFALVLATLTAYQTVVLIPILFLYDRRGWLVTLTPVATLAAFQLFERATTGTLPAQVLTGYFAQYGLQTLLNKLRNAGALTTHLGWLVFPLATLPQHWKWAAPFALAGAFVDTSPLFWLPFGLGAALLIHYARLAKTEWLAQWIVVFFAASLVIFYAGSNRYLLPLALPVAILASQSKFAKPAIALQFVLSAALAFTNFEHWSAYRNFAVNGPTWINAEWGLRFYGEAAGGLPLLRSQAVQPGEQVLSSALSNPITFTTGGGRLALLRQQEVRTTLPLCIICLDGRSAYSTVQRGFRAFNITTEPLDRITLQGVSAQRPTRSYLTMGDPDASTQIVSGIYELEGNAWRWMTDSGTVLLKRAEGPVTAKIFLPPQAPGRVVTMVVDGKEMLRQTLPGAGAHELKTPPLPAGEGDVTVTITIDQPFQVGNDARRLGLILSGVGFISR